MLPGHATHGVAVVAVAVDRGVDVRGVPEQVIGVRTGVNRAGPAARVVARVAQGAADDIAGTNKRQWRSLEAQTCAI